MVTVEKEKELIDEFVNNLSEKIKDVNREISTRSIFYNSTFRKYLKKVIPVDNKILKFCSKDGSTVTEYYLDKLTRINYFNRVRLMLENISSKAVSSKFTEDNMKELLEDIKWFKFAYKSTLRVFENPSRNLDLEKYEFKIRENDTSDLTKGFLVIY